MGAGSLRIIPAWLATKMGLVKHEPPQPASAPGFAQMPPPPAPGHPQPYPYGYAPPPWYYAPPPPPPPPVPAPVAPPLLAGASASASLDIDDPTRYPYLSDWLRELHNSPRADSQDFESHQDSLTDAGFVRLFALEDVSADELKNITGMSIGKAKLLLRYALADLRKIRNHT
jgi:hypothetical protein